MYQTGGKVCICVWGSFVAAAGVCYLLWTFAERRVMIHGHECCFSLFASRCVTHKHRYRAKGNPNRPATRSTVTGQSVGMGRRGMWVHDESWGRWIPMGRSRGSKSCDHHISRSILETQNVCEGTSSVCKQHCLLPLFQNPDQIQTHTQTPGRQ